MATLTIHNLDDTVHDGLQKRAIDNARSLEAGAEAILAEKITPKQNNGAEFYQAIRTCLTDSGGLREDEFVQPDRPPPPEPHDFRE